MISLWGHVLFHWAAPGYLMLFPLLGDALARLGDNRAVRIGLGATAAVVIAGVAVIGSEVRFNWMPGRIEYFALGADPDLDAVDWTSLRTDLASRGLLHQPRFIVAATRWLDAGKADYALGGQIRVICLGADPREYGQTSDLKDFVGDNLLIVAPRMSLAQIDARFGAAFDLVEELPPVIIRHAGQPAMLIPLFLGHHFHGH